MTSVFHRWTGHVLDALFPRSCVHCNRPGSYMCSQCLSSTATPLRPPWCELCGLPGDIGKPCLFCRDHQLELVSLRSAYAFTGVVHDAVVQFKYHGLKAAANEMADLLAPIMDQHHVDILVPVPLHPGRQKERGYNQTEVIGRLLSLRAGIEVVPQAVRRVRPTPPQAGLADRAQRVLNVAGAFSADASLVHDKRVLLLDDVCTTGATLNECARVLQAAGAASVSGLTLAREL